MKGNLLTLYFTTAAQFSQPELVDSGLKNAQVLKSRTGQRTVLI